MGLVPRDGRGVSEPVKADPEVAALTFREHLDDFFRNGRGRFPGWERIDVEPLRSVICLPASRAAGTVDIYTIRPDGSGLFRCTDTNRQT